MTLKKETVWIVVNKHCGPYVDHRQTRKDMKQHHCNTLGLMSWEEAKAKGDKCIKATLTYKY